MDTPGLVLTVTHLGAAGLGYLMCHWLTMRAGEVFIHESERPVEVPVKHEHGRWTTRSVPSVVILVLVAALVLIGIGVQSYLSQQAGDARDRCVSNWGDDLIETVGTRGRAAERLEMAQNNRDDALDSLLVAAIGIQNVPEKKKQKALADLVTGYVESVDHLHAVQKTTTKTRERNPFPKLAC